MFAPHMVVIKLPTLNYLLIKHLALLLLWTSYISSHIIAMSNLGDALITYSFKAREISLKM